MSLDLCVLIVVRGLTEGVTALIALGEPVIHMQAGVDVCEEVRGPLLELLKSIGYNPRAH